VWPLLHLFSRNASALCGDLYRISPRWVKKRGKDRCEFVCAVKQGVIEPIFAKSTLGRLLLVKESYTEFNEHPNDGLVADTRSQTGFPRSFYHVRNA
jgi:hypothetical protein